MQSKPDLRYLKKVSKRTRCVDTGTFLYLEKTWDIRCTVWKHIIHSCGKGHRCTKLYKTTHHLPTCQKGMTVGADFASAIMRPTPATMKTMSLCAKSLCMGHFTLCTCRCQEIAFINLTYYSVSYREQVDVQDFNCTTYPILASVVV